MINNLYFYLLNSVLLLAVLIPHVYSVHSPDYFPKCRRDDPNINECAKKALKTLFPYLLKGDPSVSLPSIKPFHYDKFTLQASESIHLDISDVDVYGLDTIEAKDIELNLDKNYLRINFALPIVTVLFSYIMKGKISMLPLDGDGRGNLTVDFLNDEVEFYFEWELIKRHGIEYSNIINPSVKFEAKQIYFDFDNLFKGDKAMTEHILTFMNENWRVVWEDIGEAFGQVIALLASAEARGIFWRIPYNELFVQ